MGHNFAVVPSRATRRTDGRTDRCGVLQVRNMTATTEGCIRDRLVIGGLAAAGRLLYSTLFTLHDMAPSAEVQGRGVGASDAN